MNKTLSDYIAGNCDMYELRLEIVEILDAGINTGTGTHFRWYSAKDVSGQRVRVKWNGTFEGNDVDGEEVLLQRGTVIAVGESAWRGTFIALGGGTRTRAQKKAGLEILDEPLEQSEDDEQDESGHVMRSHYLFLEAMTIEELSEVVEQHAAEGWEIHESGVLVNDTFYFVTMEKFE